MSSLNDFVNSMNKSSKKSNDASCETCTDFQDWMKQNLDKSNKNSNNSNDRSKTESQGINNKEKSILMEQAYIDECPLQRDQFGRFAWGYLHTMAAYYPNNPTVSQKTDMKTFIRTFTEFFPCEECKEDFKIE